MRLLFKKIGWPSVILFSTCIFFFKTSVGNPGIVVGGTFVLENTQYPSALKKHNPSTIYLIYSGALIKSSWNAAFFRKDTVINLKGLIDSTKGGVKEYRLIFESHQQIDSVWQTDTKYRVTDKAFTRGEGLMEIFAYDSIGKQIDKFVYNYSLKYREAGNEVPELRSLLRQSKIYSISDRNRYSAGTAWVLSVGIDKYKGNVIPQNSNCQSDAVSYNNFFKQQYLKFMGASGVFYYNEYLLTGENATREAVLKALREIAAKAAPNDYFIFNFSGFSNLLSTDSLSYATYFFPYDKKGFSQGILKNGNENSAAINEQLISLKLLQEHIQLIQAKNQLFISEAGPSEKFKTEFIKTLMQNSPTVAGILNKNRVIIVPDKIGKDDISCNGITIKKGPINYFITSLDSTKNIYNIFNEGNKANEIAYEIKRKETFCHFFASGYFDVFFERKFLQQYNEIFGDGDGQTRGLKVKPKEMQELQGLVGKHYALVVGTDSYNGKGWNKLVNPVKDARAVADELSITYGFEVQLMENKPMDSIYKAIREYYRITKPNDQLIIYFAGHGDADNELLDDGFIVCADSKSVDDDPIRNTYIPYVRLQKIVNNIPARQVLVLLDVCHGGMFDQKAFQKKDVRDGDFSTITNRNVLQFLKDKLPLRTRKFLSSVGSEPAFDGKAGQHSPFATLLLAVLREKGKGSNGIVTISDIFKVLQTAGLNETAALKISPAMADFGNVDAFSEFILIPSDKNNDPQK